MSTFPHVSIIIPTCDRPVMLREALASLMEQGGVELEVIIVDNGTTEETERMMAEASWSLPGLHYERFTEAQGAPYARNRGLALARGEWVLFLDDDDLMLPGGIESLIQEAGHGTDLVYGGYETFQADGSSNLYRPNLGANPLRALLRENPLALPGVVIKRARLLETEGFDPAFPACQDWDLYIRLATRCRFGRVERSIVRVRHHTLRLSFNVENLVQGLESLLNKHAAHYSYHPQALAYNLKYLGVLNAARGRFTEARRLMGRAIRHDPLLLKAYAHWILLLSPSLYKFLLYRYRMKREGVPFQ